MVKKKPLKKQKIRFKKEYILWLVILGLIILQALSAWQIIKLREFADRSSDFSMGVILKNSEESRYKYPIIDVTENRVYIPEARIYLPLDEASRNMRYEYREHGDGFLQKALNFSSSAVVGRQRSVEYSSCDKIVTLASHLEMPGYNTKPTATIEPTADGLTDILVYSGSKCWDQKWYADIQHGLAAVVKQAKNY